MDVRREMPEEVKNQIMPNGKKRVVTEKISDKFVKKIHETIRKKQKLTNQFLQLSIKVVQAEKAQQELLETLRATSNDTITVLQRASQKMKLQKRKDYNWRFDGRDSFVGVYNPPKPKSVKPEEKK